MKRILLATAALVIASAAHAGGIPSQFQGKWGSAADCKAIAAGNESDGITEINSTALNQYETGCDLISGKSSVPAEYTGTFKCNEEGSVSVSRVRLKLVNGQLSTNGSAPLARCTQ
jgi:hypothetical protein